MLFYSGKHTLILSVWECYLNECFQLVLIARMLSLTLTLTNFLHLSIRTELACPIRSTCAINNDKLYPTKYPRVNYCPKALLSRLYERIRSLRSCWVPSWIALDLKKSLPQWRTTQSSGVLANSPNQQETLGKRRHLPNGSACIVL